MIYATLLRDGGPLIHRTGPTLSRDRHEIHYGPGQSATRGPASEPAMYIGLEHGVARTR